MIAQEKNYWLQTVAKPAHGSSGALPETADVVVIGGGLSGLSAARALARRGVRTVVLEAETFGWGASCRNGGMVLTGMKLPVPTLISRYGRDAVQRMYAASLESIHLVEQIVKEEGIACSFRAVDIWKWPARKRISMPTRQRRRKSSEEFNHELRIIPEKRIAR